MRIILRPAALLALVFTLSQTTPLMADSSGDLMSMLESMKRQMSQMQQTIDAQNLRLQQLESARVLEKPRPDAAIQPTPASQKEAQDNLRRNIGEAIPWLRGTTYGGDFRLRMENLEYYDKNNDNGSTGTANDRSRTRFRIRLRWGFEKDFADDWKLGFRIATGNTTEPTGTNQTLGNTGYFNFKNIVLDRAYATYEPSALKDRGAVRSVKIGAGKFENPFLRYSTPIVWDADVTPEGLYERALFKINDSEQTKVDAQATAGQFLVNENAGAETDAQIYGYQGVLSVTTKAFGTEEPVSLTGAVSYYDYPNWFQTVTSNTAGVSYLRTNTLPADDFRVLDFYPEIAFSCGKTPIVLWYDTAVNLANVGTDDAAQSLGDAIHDADTAWGIGFKIGAAKKKGDAEFSYGYYAIGTNAVVAAFNDSDFGGPGANGYTNRTGHKLGLGYRLSESLVLNWTGYFVKPLTPSTAAANSAHESVFRSQVDLHYKF